MTQPTRNTHCGTGLRVVIAGGGTGGHLFPGMAIADSLLQNSPTSDVLFVSAGTPLEERILPRAGFTFKKIAAEGMKGRGKLVKVRAIMKLAMGIIKAIGIIVRFRPDIIIGMGSYSSAPVIIAAWLLGVKIVLHEQNALPGMTNRVLARFADRVFVSHEAAANHLSIDREKWVLTGNPVRRELLEMQTDDGSKAATSSKRFNILVVGGSQGAHSINLAVVGALVFINQKEGYYFVHQTGDADADSIRDRYRQAGVDCLVKPFFDDMAVQYKAADFLICRAGATTVAEMTCLGKTGLFVPFPYAADDHQTHNARALVEAGAAEMIAEKDLSDRVVAEKIEYYATNREALTEMARRIKLLGRPEAGQKIVEECLALVASPIKRRAVLRACI